MTDKPIIFSAPMIRALLEGRKTQTRRVLKPQPPEWVHEDQSPGYSCMTPPGHIEFRGHYIDPEGVDRGPAAKFIKLPHATGDRLWVRESHAIVPRLAYRGSIGTGTIQQREHPTDGYSAALFRECFDRSSGGIRWRPSIHMPRWASRLTLVVTDVRVQRVQDISEADAVAEGCDPYMPGEGIISPPKHGDEYQYRPDYKAGFRAIWDSLNAKRGFGWDANSWVTATTFTVHRCNIDQMEENQ
jgi:hypothetical protein